MFELHHIIAEKLLVRRKVEYDKSINNFVNVERQEIIRPEHYYHCLYLIIVEVCEAVTVRHKKQVSITAHLNTKRGTKSILQSHQNFHGALCLLANSVGEGLDA